MHRRHFLLRLAFLALKKGSLGAAIRLIRESTSQGDVRAATLYVRQGASVVARAFGQVRSADTVFILASITKPMTATGLMVLVDRGEVSLADPVHKFIPEFGGGDRDLITLRHLLTHTSGLPDMLPENIELRRRKAPLSDFVAGVCKTALLFRPGARVSYQSMGFLLAAEVVQRVTRMPFRDFLRNEVFLPLGMSDTSLGLGNRRLSDTAQCQVDGNDGWNWNSAYWRNLGTPWGGVHSNGRDVTRFLELFLRPGGRVLKATTARQMVTNQPQGLDEPWGLGWMIKPGTFGRACSARTFGHYGGSGTIAWADPSTRLTCVLLTTKPATHSRDGLLGPVSDLTSESGRPPG